MPAWHWLSKLLLRQGLLYIGGKPWTTAHDTCLRSQRFNQPGLQLAFNAAYETMLLTVQRRDRLDEAIGVMAADSEYTELVRRLGCLRWPVSGFPLMTSLMAQPFT
jgi:hypothetical protein